MKTTTYQPLSREVRSLFVKDFSFSLAGERFKTQLINQCDWVFTSDGYREVSNYKIKVWDTYTDYRILTLEEFARTFQVPEIPSLETLYPAMHKQYMEYVKTVYEMYNLISYDFQINDLGLFLMKDQGILSYEQGLGKTISGLVYARIKRIQDESIKRALFVVQQDLIEQWQEEGERVGMKLNRLENGNMRLKPFGNYITHYEFMRKHYRDYINSFQLIELDEAHKIKSGDALRGIAIRSLEAHYKICLSGTPIKNIVSDLHFLMGWLYGFKSQIYPYAEDQQFQFKKDYGVYEIIDGKRKLIPKVSNVHGLQLMLAPAILRRDISECGVKVPQKSSYLIEVEFTDEQKIAYDKIRESTTEQTTRDYQCRVNCAIYPGNNKIKALQRIVEARLERGEQVIVFTGLVPAGREYVRMFGNRARLVNGDVYPREREGIIKSFKRNDFPILIAGIECVNSGHSLQNCNNVVVTDYPWTASTLDQACGRVRRIVSTKDINIFMLYTRDSYDERMIDIINQKRASSEEVLDGENDFLYTNINWKEATIEV